MNDTSKKYYKTIAILTFILLSMGLAMVYSASYSTSSEKFGYSYYFFFRQIIYAVVGIFIMYSVSLIDYRVFKKLAYLLLILSCLLVILTFIPGIGRKINGANRWLGLGPINVQPSEMAKVFLIIFLAYLLEKKESKLDSFSYGFLPCVLIPGIIMIFVLLQRDLGSFAIMGCMIFIMMFLGGVRIRHLFLPILLFCTSIGVLILVSPYRLNRILAFMHPFQHYNDKGYQSSQSLISFGAGGILGIGPGNSMAKRHYLPESFTDYIFSILAEELGFIGVFAVIVIFTLFFIAGIMMSLKVKDRFGRLLGLGLTILITMQAFINMAVCTNILPPKGLVLPFFSYGGSSLIINLFAVGILLSIARDLEDV
jgi:cell division protein FtsW